MTLSKEEVEALKAYFDETTINMTRLQKKICLDKIRVFDKVIYKIYTNALTT